MKKRGQVYTLERLSLFSTLLIYFFAFPETPYHPVFFLLQIDVLVLLRG